MTVGGLLFQCLNEIVYVKKKNCVFRTKHFGDRSETNIARVVKEKQDEFPNYIVEIRKNPFCICIVTPIMRRAHGLPLSKDIVFVDASGGSRVTFIIWGYKSRWHTITRND